MCFLAEKATKKLKQVKTLYIVSIPDIASVCLSYTVNSMGDGNGSHIARSLLQCSSDEDEIAVGQKRFKSTSGFAADVRPELRHGWRLGVECGFPFIHVLIRTGSKSVSS